MIYCYMSSLGKIQPIQKATARMFLYHVCQTSKHFYQLNIIMKSSWKKLLNSFKYLEEWIFAYKKLASSIQVWFPIYIEHWQRHQILLQNYLKNDSHLSHTDLQIYRHKIFPCRIEKMETDQISEICKTLASVVMYVSTLNVGQTFIQRLIMITRIREIKINDN